MCSSGVVTPGRYSLGMGSELCGTVITAFVRPLASTMITRPDDEAARTAAPGSRTKSSREIFWAVLVFEGFIRFVPSGAYNEDELPSIGIDAHPGGRSRPVVLLSTRARRIPQKVTLFVVSDTRPCRP